MALQLTVDKLIKAELTLRTCRNSLSDQISVEKRTGEILILMIARMELEGALVKVRNAIINLECYQKGFS